MTNEIEKTFFDTFGIEPEYKTCPFNHCIHKKEYDCDNCDNREWKYPEITDHILLELICILTAWYLDEREPYEITGYNIKLLKNQVLQDCNSLKNIQKVKKKVKALFKDGE